MGEFNRQICLSNIYFLTKAKGLKIGDLETQAGVSVGYFSRLLKEGNTTNPPIDVLAAVATRLGVSLDALSSYRLEELTASEQYVMDFVERLIERTSSFQLLWDRESEASLESVEIDDNGEPMHPLLESKFINGAWKTVYASRFAQDVFIAGDGFSTQISRGTDVYLMWVKESLEDMPFENAEYGYEFYMVQGGVARPLCSFRQKPFKEALTRLGAVAEESSKHVRLNDAVRTAIDAFMRDTSALESLDDDDSDLPF